MKKKLTLLLIIVTAICIGGCSSPDKASAKRVVRQFIEGLYARDENAITQVAPFFNDIEKNQKENLYKNIDKFDSWNIDLVQKKNKNATVMVTFTDNNSETQLRFPLKAKGDSWIIREKISFTTTIDFIPAESESES